MQQTPAASGGAGDDPADFAARDAGASARIERVDEQDVRHRQEGRDRTADLAAGGGVALAEVGSSAPSTACVAKDTGRGGKTGGAQARTPARGKAENSCTQANPR